MANEIMKITDFSTEFRVIVKLVLEQAKKENRAKIVGRDYDGYTFIDDALDWYPGIDLRGVFATVFPDGTIRHGFVEVENK